jgi:hypothetical protein
MVNLNYCVMCPGELTEEETEAGDWASYNTGRFYCTECGVMYVQVRPTASSPEAATHTLPSGDHLER